MAEAEPERNIHELTCQTCGTSFTWEKTDPRVWKIPEYCSHECRPSVVRQRAGGKRDCEACGGFFYVSSIGSGARFCSREACRADREARRILSRVEEIAADCRDNEALLHRVTVQHERLTKRPAGKRGGDTGI